ncbi:MAG: chemotaxis protein CheB [Gammaproteobacteria bacterium]|jgi:two-component system CheB/CheR fusion protein
MAKKKKISTVKRSPPQKTTLKSSNVTKRPIFPIVGVGASAGGLEAFSALLRALPTDSGMALVLVQHLHPGYESALTEILARETELPVQEAHDSMNVQPNHIYVIPPSVDLEIHNGILHLVTRLKENRHRLPIDHFFRSLAEDRGGRAIGVILSGTASDGVLGLKSIKAQGGITFAQDEKTAKYDGMPHSAIAAGMVDFILSPAKIAAELSRIAKHPYVVRERTENIPEILPSGTDDLNEIFLLLRRHSGHDFTYYKHTTIQRRIKRRLVLHRLEKLSDYVRYLTENPDEVNELFHDILINVTGFFRDEEAFDALRENVFPNLAKKNRDTPLRIWIPGCSSGEEVYSIAIELLDYLGESASARVIQIFATDIDEYAIEKARAGIYPENIAQDISAERLRRFFAKVEGGHQISKAIRDMCVFAVQNVIKDPPFSKLDLISCRNLLIYLGPVLQKRVLNVFHYALNPDGYLLLGSAESIGEFANLYSAVDAKAKVYTKKAVPTPHPIEFTLRQEGVFAPVPLVELRPTTECGRFNLQQETDRLLLNQFVPAAVVINEQMDIQQFRGHTGPYLEPAPGEASFNLSRMAREDLIVDLSGVVKEAIKTKAAAEKTGVQVRYNGHSRIVDIEVLPMKIPTEAELHYLVVFKDRTPSEKISEEPAIVLEKTPAGDKDQQRLQQELAATKEYLQSVIEQQETSNEELRSAYEEIQSSNEELQSINEELETAKEELQSTNEELATVNDELQSRNQELKQANNDLSNLIGSVNIPIIIVDRDLRIRRFTPGMDKLFNLISTDLGRPIGDIQPKTEIPNFIETVTSVIENVKSYDIKLQNSQSHWYSVRIHPYLIEDSKIDGAVIAFIDIDQIKRSLDLASAAQQYAEAVIEAVRHPMLVLDINLRVVSCSAAYRHVFHVTEKQTIGNLLYRLGNGQWGVPELRERLEVVINQGCAFDDLVITHDFQNIGIRTMLISGRQIPAGISQEAMVLMQIEDITDREQITTAESNSSQTK